MNAFSSVSDLHLLAPRSLSQDAIAPVVSRTGGLKPKKPSKTASALVGEAVVAPAVTPTDPLAPTIFHAPWWLDAVTGGTCEQVEVHSGGACIGRLPFVRRRQLGMTFIGLPMLTHFLGAGIDEGTGGATTRALRRISTTRELLAKLPRHDSIWMKFHRGVTETLAFQSAGYVNEVQFTTEIAPAAESVLWSGMRDTARRVIRRAGEKLTVRELDDPERYIAFYGANLDRRGRRNAYDPAICRAAIAACQGHDAGRVLVAEDKDGKLVAGIFTIWDQTSEYYLLTTRTPEADNGAIALLLWTAIRHASAHGLIFDLDGISNRGDIQFLTRFGGSVVPRYFVSHGSLASKAAHKLRLLR